MLDKIGVSITSGRLGALVLLWLIGSVGTVLAQSNDNRSPYSRFGYGSLQPQTTVAARGLGNIGIGLRDAMITSPTNPASYTAVDSLTFLMDVGVSLKGSFFQEGDRRDSRLLGNLDYLTMLFPMGRYLAMSAGVTPYASTGYHFGSLAPLQGDARGEESFRGYTGDGHYNVLHLGLAARPLRPLSVGVNAGLLFGNTKHERQIVYSNSTADKTVVSERLGLRGLKLDFGVQYELQLDTLSSRSLVLGATFTPAVALRSNFVTTHQRAGTAGTETVQTDTLSLRDGYSLPLSVGFGASYRVKNKLLVGADVRYAKWSDARFYGAKAEFQDQWSLHTGLEWQPNYRARSLFSRTKYRFGLEGGTSYLNVPIGQGAYQGYYQIGASVGLGIPLVDRRSVLNVGVAYKHLLPRASGMVREQYLELSLGLSFNEGWFRKARVH